MVGSRYFKHHLRTLESFSSATILCGGGRCTGTGHANGTPPCFKRTPFLLWFHLTAPLKSHRRSQRSQKENKGRASEGEQKRRDPTTPRCVWVECVRAIFTVTKDKMDVFKDGIVFIFSKMIQRHLALPFSFLHRHLLDVISAEMIIIANVEA